MIYFFNMRYGVYYYVVKFQLKTLAMDGEMKRTNYIRGQNEPNNSLGDYPDFGYN